MHDFEESSITAELLARLTNDDIYYIGWGSNTNAIASAAFLYKHSLKGTVIDIETLDALKHRRNLQPLAPKNRNSS